MMIKFINILRFAPSTQSSSYPSPLAATFYGVNRRWEEQKGHLHQRINPSKKGKQTNDSNTPVSTSLQSLYKHSDIKPIDQSHLLHPFHLLLNIVVDPHALDSPILNPLGGQASKCCNGSRAVDLDVGTLKRCI